MLNEAGAAMGAIGVVKESMIYRYGAGRMVASPRPAFYDATMSDIDPKDLIRIAHEDGTDGKAQPLDLGARVRELRKAQDWTLEQAANQAGLARSTLSKIENGQMSPTYEALKK
jgi:DNA-binding XRE family transcriptional regulator